MSFCYVENAAWLNNPKVSYERKDSQYNKSQNNLIFLIILLELIEN